MDEDDVMREMKDEEENHEEEVGDVMEDLETSLRRTAEVFNGLQNFCK